MATFYLRADGSATKANATGPASDATKCMSVATHNASTFAAGDQILLSSQGGDFTTGLSVPSSGTSGNPIIYGAVDGETPVIRVANIGFQAPGTRNYWTLQDVSIILTNALATDIAVYFASGCTGVTLQRLTLDSAGYGLKTDGTTTNLLVQDITTSARLQQSAVFLKGTGNTSPTIRRITTAKAGAVSIENSSGTIAISDITTVGQSTGYGVYLKSSTATVTMAGLNLSGNQYGVYLDANASLTSATIAGTISGSTAAGIYISSSANVIADGLTITGGAAGILIYGTSSALRIGANPATANWSTPLSVDISGGSSDGIRVGTLGGPSNVTFCRVRCHNGAAYGWFIQGTSSNIALSYCIADANAGDGFGMGDSANTITYLYCIADGNGGGNHTDAGDGFTAHNTNHTINIHYCLAVNNTLAGMSHVGQSSGNIYNCVLWGNGTDTARVAAATRAALDIFTTGANPTSGRNWTVRNCIIGGQVASERGNDAYALMLGPDADSAALNDLDYNLYHAPNSARVVIRNTQGDGTGTVQDWATYHADRETHSLYGDPRFRNAAGGNFQPGPGSPARNAGVDVSLTSDYAGNPVPLGAGVDIGAYETIGSTASIGRPGIGGGLGMPGIG